MQTPDNQGGGIPEQLINLIRLSRLDEERDTNQRLIDREVEVIGAREKELVAQKERVDRATRELRDARTAVDRAELELRSRADHVRKLELQLNTAKSNVEYQGLQQQIKRLRDETAVDEDAGLALYEKIETLEGKVKEEQAKAATCQSEFDAFVTAYRSDGEAAREEIRSTDERRAALLNSLPPDLKATYDRVRTARGGVIIVPLEGRTCSGCGMSLTPNAAARIRGLSSVVACDSCLRVLYAPESLKIPND